MGCELATMRRVSMKKKLAIVVIIGFVMICIWLFNYGFVKPEDFNNAVYTVVIYNDTGYELDSIMISYQHDPNDPKIEYTRINNISRNEYRKINIPTNIEEIGTYGSFNVFVNIETIFGNQEVATGYFGTGTGGFSVEKISKENGMLVIESVSPDNLMYKHLYWRHIRNQYETSWKHI